MSKIRQSPVVLSRRRKPFFVGERKVTAKELEENGAPRRGIISFILRGIPPEEGTGRYSTGNAAERVSRSLLSERA